MLILAFCLVTIAHLKTVGERKIEKKAKQRVKGEQVFGGEGVR